jgi:hypothetical protein
MYKDYVKYVIDIYKVCEYLTNSNFFMLQEKKNYHRKFFLI